VELAAAADIDGRWRAFDDPELADVVASAGAVVSTIPADAAARHVAVLRAAPVLLDAIYDPWPTPLAAAVTETGGRVIDGLQLLLHQAFAQVEQFTGRPAPKEAMRAALARP
jgi:shikimate dehydrogenase